MKFLNILSVNLVNGERHWQTLHQVPYTQVCEWIDFYKNSSGKEYQVQTKYEYTENPSIQGMWHPFVNADPSIATAKFPIVSSRKKILLKVGHF